MQKEVSPWQYSELQHTREQPSIFSHCILQLGHSANLCSLAFSASILSSTLLYALTSWVASPWTHSKLVRRIGLREEGVGSEDSRPGDKSGR
jgi:hypothetical protein